MTVRLRRPRWPGWRAGGLVGAIALVLFWHAQLLHRVGAFLVVDEPLEPAAAIVVLAGGLPFRELEAADLYRAGVAPRIILVPERQNQEPALQARGLPTTSDLRREVLVRRGVPPETIVVLEDQAVATIDELQIVARALPPGDAPVVLVTSKYHSRRAGLAWSYVAGQQRAVVRAARYDPYTPDGWWRDPPSVLAVVREYVGLLELHTRLALAAPLHRLNRDSTAVERPAR